MRLSEQELQRILTGNPTLRIREFSKKNGPCPTVPKSETQKPAFDSEAERRYYESYIWPGILAGTVKACEVHKTFELLPAISYCGKKYKDRVYTPDFYLEYADGTVEVVEVKGKQVRKWQRDYPIRRNLFLLHFCIPNGWRFREVIDDPV